MAKDGRLRLTLQGADGNPLEGKVRVKLKWKQGTDPHGPKEWDASKLIEIGALHRQPVGLYTLTVSVGRPRAKRPGEWKWNRELNELVTIPASGDLGLTYRDWKKVADAEIQPPEPTGPGLPPKPAGPAVNVQPGGNVIGQDGKTPVEITGYSATLEPLADRHGGPRIRHAVSYRNRRKRAIAAVQFGLACFDVFDELIGPAGCGLALQPLAPAGAKDVLGQPVPPSTREWLQHDDDLLAFQTAFAWVDKVRFDDGEVWRQSRKKIAGKIRKLKSSYDPSPLEKKPDRD